MKLKILAIALALSVSACTPDSPDSHSEGSEFDAIFWHENNRYTVWVDTDGIISKRRLPNNRNIRYRLIKDVSAAERGNYECRWLETYMSGIISGNCDIHIYNIDDLKGGDWNHGKFGSGSTTRID